MANRKRVAVIGAGPAGIVSMRALLEENIEPVCFERTSHYGGLWRYHDEDIDGLASVMKTTVMNNSKEMQCLSNVIIPSEFSNYMHNSDVYRTMQHFMKESEMFRYVQYNKQIIKVEFAEDYQETGKYDVTFKDTKTGDIGTGTFDGVLICVGHHVYPKWVTFPGQEKFKGRIIHTHSLKKVDGYEDKNVVVVGLGNSAADAASEISNYSKQVYLSTRRGSWIVSRLGPKGIPTDMIFLRRWINFLLQLLPYSWFCWICEQYIQMKFDHSLFNLKPDHHILSQHPTMSDSLPIKIISGSVLVRGNIKMFTEDGVIFEGETKVTPVDEVVLGTGYLTKFPFLGEDITSVKNNEVHLYKYMYPPHLPHPSLAFIGLLQILGSGCPAADSQSRLAAYALSGRIKLPNREEMEADIAAYKQYRKKRFVNSSRHTIQCDFIPYLDEVNELFGAKPNLLKYFFTDPKLWWALMFGPHLPYQYRLQGPNPWPPARDAILTCNERMMKPLQNYRERKTGNDEKLELNFGVKFFFMSIFFYFFSLLCSLSPRDPTKSLSEQKKIN